MTDNKKINLYSKNLYETKKKQIESGKSEIFNNWHDSTGLTMKNFLEGLKWLEADPLTDTGLLTRELGCRKNGDLVKIKRCYSADCMVAFYEEESGFLWNKSNPSINKGDRI